MSTHKMCFNAEISKNIHFFLLKQDLSPDRIARLILHILFLEKSVTLILT